MFDPPGFGAGGFAGVVLDVLVELEVGVVEVELELELGLGLGLVLVLVPGPVLMLGPVLVVDVLGEVLGLGAVAGGHDSEVLRTGPGRFSEDSGAPGASWK